MYVEGHDADLCSGARQGHAQRTWFTSDTHRERSEYTRLPSLTIARMFTT